MSHSVVILISFFITLFAYSQNPADSLKQQLEHSNDAGKVQIYNLLAERYIKSDSALTFEYAAKAIKYAKMTDSKKGQATAKYLKGEAYYYSGEYARAIAYYNQSLLDYTQLSDTSNMVETDNSIGLANFYMQNFEESVNFYFEGLRWAEKKKDQVQMSRLYSNISMVYTKMEDYESALFYYRKALAINRSLNRKENIGVNLNGIGVTFFRMNRLDSAKVYYMQALKILKETEDRQRIAILLNNLANIYANQKDSLTKALDFYQKSEEIFIELNDHQNMVHVIDGIGSVYREMGQYSKAVETYLYGIQLTKKYVNDYQLLQLYYSDLAFTYEKTGDYRQALLNEKIQSRYADSLLNINRIKEIEKLKGQFDTEKKEAEIGRLKAEKKLILAENRYQKILALTSICFLLIALFYVSYRYAEKRRNNKILEAMNFQIKKSEEELRVLNASKNKFFSIIAHDLKSPFHTVMGYSQLLDKRYDSYSEKDRKAFIRNICNSANTIFRLLSNLLDWSSSQTDRVTFTPIKIEFVLIYDNVVNLLKSAADQKHIVIHADFKEDQEIFADPVMIETVIRNLVSNAVKYSQEGGEITVSVHPFPDKIRIIVEDNGVGIKPENLEKLFQIDSKIKQKGTWNEDGSGIGLILCKELIDRHSGKIWAESNLEKGSRFFIELPYPAGIIMEDDID